MTVPTPAQWHAVSWHARERWAQQRGLTVREATRAVTADTDRGTVLTIAGRRFAAVYPPTPASTPDELAQSFADDHDPVVVAMRRAAASGLPLTHHDVTAGLPPVRRRLT